MTTKLLTALLVVVTAAVFTWCWFVKFFSPLLIGSGLRDRFSDGWQARFGDTETQLLYDEVGHEMVVGSEAIFWQTDFPLMVTNLCWIGLTIVLWRRVRPGGIP